jgi:hypothetical protein
MRWSGRISDPVIRAAFERAERDYHQSFAIPDESATPNTQQKSLITHRSTTMNHRQIPISFHSLSLNPNQCTGEQTTSPDDLYDDSEEEDDEDVS